MRQLLVGALVPHAPLLLPEVESDEVAPAAGAIRAAVRALDVTGAEALVLLSPHGFGHVVHARASGSLAAMGLPDVKVEAADAPDAVHALAAASGWPVSPAALDHGAVVPLALRAWELPVAVAAFDGIERARSSELADAINELSGERDLAVVASVNTSAGLSPRSPMPDLPHARDVEGRLITALQRDLGDVAEVVGDLGPHGGSCSAAPLMVMAQLFGGRRAEVLAYEAPVGVGYLVAAIT